MVAASPAAAIKGRDITVNIQTFLFLSKFRRCVLLLQLGISARYILVDRFAEV